MTIQHLRSSTANKRPTPAAMSDGQLAVNTNTASPGLFFKDSAGALIKVGPVHVGTTAPNASPASGGETGNTVGEQWLDTSGGTYVFKVWDGSAWRSESGTFVDVNGDVMTGALGIIAGSAGSPGLYFSGDTNTGLYSPGADQVAISTNSTQRLLIDASGNVNIDSNTFYVDAINNRVAIGTTSPGYALDIINNSTYQLRLASSTSNYASGGLYLGAAGTGDPYYYGYVRWNQDSTTLDIAAQDGTGSGGLRFLTNGGSTSPTERARIDVSGRLLVGTSSSSAEAKFIVQGGATAAGGAINIQRNATTASAGSTIGFINFANSANNVGATISADGDGTWSAGTSHPTLLKFSTTADGASSPTERMRIDSLGILIKYGDSTTARILPQTDNAGYIGESNKRWQAIYAVNGTIQTSDEREKTNIIDSPLGADFIRSLRPVAYKWKIGGYTSTYDKDGKETITPNPGVRTHYGFIAQEVKQAVGETDFGGWLQEDLNDPDSKQSLRLHEFISPIVKALQEALDEIDILKAEVAALKAQ